MSRTHAPATLAAQLQAALDRLAASRDVHHALVAVEQGEGAFRWVGTAGEACPGGEPMRAETPFFIASIDKLLTATLVLQLHEEGCVRLDAPLTTALPSLDLTGLHRMDGVDHTGAITVRHLLSHTSGLAEWLEDRPELHVARRGHRGGDRAAAARGARGAAVPSTRVAAHVGRRPLAAARADAGAGCALGGSHAESPSRRSCDRFTASTARLETC